MKAAGLGSRRTLTGKKKQLGKGAECQTEGKVGNKQSKENEKWEKTEPNLHNKQKKSLIKKKKYI